MALLRQCNVVVWGCETQQEQEVKDGTAAYGSKWEETL